MTVRYFLEVILKKMKMNLLGMIMRVVVIINWETLYTVAVKERSSWQALEKLKYILDSGFKLTEDMFNQIDKSLYSTREREAIVNMMQPYVVA